MTDVDSTEYKVESIQKEDGDTFRLWDDEEIVHTETNEFGLEIWYLTPEGHDR